MDTQLHQHAARASAESQSLSRNTFEVADIDDVSLADYLTLAYRRRWWIICAIFTVVAFGVVYTLLQPKVYQARASLLISTPVTVKSDDIPLLSELQALKQSRSIDTIVEMLGSRDLLNQAFDELPQTYRTQYFGTIKVLPGTVSISAKKNSDVVNISVNAYSRKAAEAYVTKILETFFDRDIRQNQRATRQARLYVEQNLDRLDKELQATRTQLSRMKQANKIVAPQKQLELIAMQISDLEGELGTQRSAYAAAMQYSHSLKQQLDVTDTYVIANTVIAQNPQFTALRKEIDELYSQRSQLLQTLTVRAAEVRALDGRISDTEQRLTQISKDIIISSTNTRNPVQDELINRYAVSVAEYSAAEARITSLEREKKHLESTAVRLPELERKLEELTQRQVVLGKTYEMLTQRLHSLLISEESTLPNARIIDTAWAPSDPVSPRPVTNIVVSLVFGVIAAILLVMVIERLDDRIHEQESAERMTGMISLSRIPHDSHGTLLVNTLPYHSEYVEGYRILRNNITYLGIDQPIQCLAITSSGPSEGKSVTVANLAMVFAQEGKRVLVIDCDFHRANVHALFGVSSHLGLTNVIVGTSTLEEAVIHTKVAGVSLLLTGPLPPNPSEVLGSQQIRRLMTAMREQFDLIILDCPPCVKMSEIQSIATLVDAMLFIVALERTHAADLQRDVRALAQMQAPLAGMVINFVKTSGLLSRPYRYAKYYAGYSKPVGEGEAIEDNHD